MLKIIENSEKQSLLKNPKVKRFISAANLAHEDTTGLIQSLFEKEAQLVAPSFIRSLFEVRKNDLKSLIKFQEAFQPFMNALKRSKISQFFEKSATQALERAFKEIPEDELKEYGKDFVHALIGRVDEKSIECENAKLTEIDAKIKEKTGIGILASSNLLLCPRCNVILSPDEFVGSKKCHNCDKNIVRGDVKQVFIHKIHEQIKEVWQSNLWFEAYIARLLRKMRFKTWTAVHVMGASGILHEVDVLAIKEGMIIICECKTGKVSRNDVFNFHTKLGDLKAHFSILALIRELPEPETREFIRKNPSITAIENIGIKKESEILSELTQRFSF